MCFLKQAHRNKSSPLLFDHSLEVGTFPTRREVVTASQTLFVSAVLNKR